MLTILWDNDGVLVDTQGCYYQACRAVISSIGLGKGPQAHGR